MLLNITIMNKWELEVFLQLLQAMVSFIWSSILWVTNYSEPIIWVQKGNAKFVDI